MQWYNCKNLPWDFNLKVILDTSWNWQIFKRIYALNNTRIIRSFLFVIAVKLHFFIILFKTEEKSFQIFFNFNLWQTYLMVQHLFSIILPKHLNKTKQNKTKQNKTKSITTIFFHSNWRKTQTSNCLNKLHWMITTKFTK